MTGDTVVLYEIAERLGKTVEELDIDLIEFYDWKRKIEMDWNNPSRSDYYLMQIARNVFTVLMKGEEAKKYGAKDFVIRFKTPEKKRKIPVAKALPDEESQIKLDEEEVKKKMAASKAYWGALVGMKLE